MTKHIIELEVSAVPSMTNVVASLIAENAAAMKDVGVIQTGGLMFKAADKATPENFKFFTQHPIGKMLSCLGMIVGCQVYNHEAAGAVATAMYANAVDGLLAAITPDLAEKAKGQIEVLHVKSACVNPTDLSERKVQAAAQAHVTADTDTRFSSTIGETAGADMPTIKEPEGDYWPADQKDLIIENGKCKCGICHTFVKRNKLGLVTPAEKTPVLACGGCREAVAKTNKEVAALAAVKAEETEYFDTKAEITSLEAALEVAERKIKSFEAMLKADPEDDVTQAAVAGANAKIAALNDKLLELYEKVQAYETKAGLSTPKTSTEAPKTTGTASKPGVLAKLAGK